AQQQQRMQQWTLRVQAFQARAAQLGLSPQSLFKTVTHAKEIEFDVLAEVKVARAKLEVEYDDKGNVKEYTPEELKKKRDAELPGYTAKVEDLQFGQTVKLYLTKPKTTPKKATSKKDDKDGDEGDKETKEAKKEEKKDEAKKEEKKDDAK